MNAILYTRFLQPRDSRKLETLPENLNCIEHKRKFFYNTEYARKETILHYHEEEELSLI